MYRCTECHSEYKKCPDFCDCGNDTFEEVEEEYYYEEEPAIIEPQPKRKLSPEEKKAIAKEKLEKKKSLIALGVTFVLCILVFILPPHKKPKMEKVKQQVSQQNLKLPAVGSYWNDTLPSAFNKKKNAKSNLSLLNTSNISYTLRSYLNVVQNSLNKKWDRSIIKGAGECKVEFTINKEGTIDYSKIVTTSNNESLDDSVLLVFSKTNSFEIPPDEYKGERIYITFKVFADGSSKVEL